MGADENKQAVVTALGHWNAHDDIYFELYEEGAPIHGLAPDLPPTVEGLKAMLHAMWSAMPDITIEPIQIAFEGDVGAGHVRLSGTHEGELMGAAPTGNLIEVEVMLFLRFSPQAKVLERWMRLDEIALLTQLGLMPQPEEAPA